MNKERLRIQLLKWLPYVAIAALGLLVSDLSILALRSATLPLPRPVTQLFVPLLNESNLRGMSAYSVIVDRNIFNSDGLIPNPVGTDTEFDENKAVPTQLPIDLVATIIHTDPAQSLAVLRVRKDKIPEVRQMGEDVSGLAEIVGIRRGRVFIQDRTTRRLEYIELPFQESEISFGEFHTQESTEFHLERKEIEGYTQNLAQVLQQARAIPETGPSGEVLGFRVVDIQAGSVFEKLGIKKGDLIRGVNGRRLDSVSKAMELYNTLRAENTIAVDIERNGRSETLSYSLN